MKSIFFIFVAMTVYTSFSHATEETTLTDSENEAALTEKHKEQTFISYCGSVDELISIMGLPAGETVTEADLTELQSLREPIMSVIKEGATALDKISEEGNKTDIGGFGVILTCGVISSISEAVKERGCKDLKTNEVIHDGPGIQLCKDLLGNIMKD